MTTTTKYLSVRPVSYFLRQLGEMILAMLAGMVASVAVLALIFSTVLAATIRGMPRVELLNSLAAALLMLSVTEALGSALSSLLTVDIADGDDVVEQKCEVKIERSL